MAINSGHFSKALWPGVNSWYAKAYSEYGVETMLRPGEWKKVQCPTDYLPFTTVIPHTPICSYCGTNKGSPHINCRNCGAPN